jgi:uncharacterized Rmd1/YagE family protein
MEQYQHSEGQESGIQEPLLGNDALHDHDGGAVNVNNDSTNVIPSAGDASTSAVGEQQKVGSYAQWVSRNGGGNVMDGKTAYTSNTTTNNVGRFGTVQGSVHPQQQHVQHAGVKKAVVTQSKIGPRPLQRVAAPTLKPGKPIAPGQPPPQYRMKDRFVSLPDAEGDGKKASYYGRLSDEYQREDGGMLQQQVPSIFQDVEQGVSPFASGDARGRITSYCVAETIDRKLLTESLMKTKVANIQSFPEVLYARHESYSKNRNGPGRVVYSDVFYFDYGTVVIWNMSLQEERLLMEKVVKPAAIDPLDDVEVEVDEFLFHYTMSEKPHIQNDTFTINYRYADDHLVKLSMSHALAQSTKLSVYEYRVVAIVEETKDLPEILASTGKVVMGRKQVAQLMGRVFLQKSAVNLLSSVLDTPDFFWESDIPDSLQHLYEGCTEYLEYENRVEVLNSRFQVLQEMLDMIRDHQNNNHTARLEWIVIWLILVEIIIGVVGIWEHV